MILGADCTVGVTQLGERQVFTLTAALGGVPVQSVELLGSLSVGLGADGRVVAIYATGSVPPGARLGPP